MEHAHVPGVRRDAQLPQHLPLQDAARLRRRPRAHLPPLPLRNRRRQLVVHADPPLLDAVVAHLRDALELTPMTGGGGGDDPALKAYEQGAYAISRKALMPILRKLEASAL